MEENTSPPSSHTGGEGSNYPHQRTENQSHHLDLPRSLAPAHPPSTRPKFVKNNLYALFLFRGDNLSFHCALFVPSISDSLHDDSNLEGCIWHCTDVNDDNSSRWRFEVTSCKELVIVNRLVCAIHLSTLSFLTELVSDDSSSLETTTQTTGSHTRDSNDNNGKGLTATRGVDGEGITRNNDTNADNGSPTIDPTDDLHDLICTEITSEVQTIYIPADAHRSDFNCRSWMLKAIDLMCQCELLTYRPGSEMYSNGLGWEHGYELDYGSRIRGVSQSGYGNPQFLDRANSSRLDDISRTPFIPSSQDPNDSGINDGDLAGRLGGRGFGVTGTGTTNSTLTMEKILDRNFATIVHMPEDWAFNRGYKIITSDLFIVK